MPKLEEIFTTVAIVCHWYDRLAVFKMFSRVFCFEQVDALIDFCDELYSSEISKDENREQRLKEPFVTTKMLKLTKILEHLALRGKFVVFFVLFFCLFCSLYKTNRFHVAVNLFVSNGSQRTSKCGKKHQWFSRLRLVCHFAVFTTVIYYWTDAWQYGIYLKRVLQSAMIKNLLQYRP